MPIMYAQVGPIPSQSIGDGTNAPWLQGKAGEVIDSNLHGKYYTAGYRGRVFCAPTLVAGTTLTVPTAVTSLYLLYNPVGSGVNVEVISADVGLLGATTVIGTIFGCVSSQIPTGFSTPLAALTFPTGQSTVANQAKAYTAATITSITTSLMPLFQVYTTATAAVALHYDFDGKVILAPGSIMTLASSPAQTANTANNLFWAEFPI